MWGGTEPLKVGPRSSTCQRESTCRTFNSRFVNEHRQDMWNGGTRRRSRISGPILCQFGFVAHQATYVPTLTLSPKYVLMHRSM